MADDDGWITLVQAFKPYGDVLSSDGEGESTYGYAGERAAAYIKLIYLRSRYYAYETGRFLTRDTWQGDYTRPLSLNLWNYAEGNPVRYRDPTGYYTEEDYSGINGTRSAWCMEMGWRGIEFDGEYWETSELGNIREGMIKMIDFLGFSRFTTIIQSTPEGQLTLVKLGGNIPSQITPGIYAGAKTWDDEILFSTVTFDPGRHPNWTFVHEFAHIWDQDGVLSEQFERLTGGMDRFVWDSRSETGQLR